jgi:rhodanese-related sulfurtransferase/DNA-binding transcriptional ArsR family regulator
MMPQANETLYEELAKLASALASPVRLRALNLLLQEPKAVEELAAALGESQANTTAHMKALRAAGLVIAERRGKYLYQKPADMVVLRLFLALRSTGEILSPHVRLLNEAPDDTASSLSPAELEALVEEKKVVLVDLRPAREFKVGHIPGARSLPLDSLPQKAALLPSKRRILAYCRGRYCPNAKRGVHALREAGVRAERLRFGVPEWMADGRQLVSGGPDV